MYVASSDLQVVVVIFHRFYVRDVGKTTTRVPDNCQNETLGSNPNSQISSICLKKKILQRKKLIEFE